MEYNLSSKVKELCRQRGIQLKDLAQKMGIAPESLSRAINGNPQLSTIKEQVSLNAIIVCKGQSYVAQNLSELKQFVEEIERKYYE